MCVRPNQSGPLRTGLRRCLAGGIRKDACADRKRSLVRTQYRPLVRHLVSAALRSPLPRSPSRPLQHRPRLVPLDQFGDRRTAVTNQL